MEIRIYEDYRDMYPESKGRELTERLLYHALAEAGMPDLVRISRMITSTTSISSVLHTPISNMFICLYPVVFIVFRRAILVQERIRILVFIVGIIGVDDIQFMKLFVESFSLFLHRPEDLIVFGILQRLFLSLFL
jgi:hypothetical protein